MTGRPLPAPDHPVGSFAEAARFRLRIALGLSHSERLRDLEAMWDFNDAHDRGTESSDPTHCCTRLRAPARTKDHCRKEQPSLNYPPAPRGD